MNSKTNVPNAGELMNDHVHTVSPELSLMELIDDLLENKVSNAPVIETIDNRKYLIGFISEGDALGHLSNEMFYNLPEPKKSVRAFMKRHPIAITADVDLFTIASLLINHGHRHVPVVDTNNQLLGIISRRDVLKSMRTFYASADKEHNAEFFPPDLTKIVNHRFIVSN